MDKYKTARQDAGFSWHVNGTVYTLLESSGISLYDYFSNVKANIKMYKEGLPRFRETFGDDVTPPSISTPHVSYGHVSGIGAPLTFPHNGEVGVSPIFDSIGQAVAYMEKHRNVDFSTTGVTPWYMDFQRQLQDAFPGKAVGYANGGEGPITSSYLLRGQELYYDIYDEPELTRRFIELVTESECAYNSFVARSIRHTDAISPKGGGLADDSASMIPDSLFDEFVVPFWDAHYRANTSGRRSIHVEDLRSCHVKYLEKVGIDRYDPSVSPLLLPKMIYEHCRVPFEWRLNSYHLWEMSVDQVRDFVYHLAADGASGTFLGTEHRMSEGENLVKVKVYIETCKQVSAMIKEGVDREEIRKLAKVKDGNTYWKNWVGYKGFQA